MYKKQFLVFGKLWLLLLLFCQPIEAKVRCGIEQRQNLETASLFKTENLLHEDMLQTQAMSLRVASEHSVKAFSFGYATLPYSEKGYPVYLEFSGTAIVFIQDENRCESVSCLLFPYHFFW